MFYKLPLLWSYYNELNNMKMSHDIWLCDKKKKYYVFILLWILWKIYKLVRLTFRRMKADLQDLRRRGAIRTSECSLGESGVRSCSLCRAGLGWIVNRGAVCQACRKRVCKACREYAVRTVDWVCTVCYKRT